jgi:hypothetical protein
VTGRSPHPFDPLRALETLISHRVDFVVIGAFAGRLLGSPSVTRDLDVCYSREPENLERLAAALVELKARLRAAPTDVPFKLDARSLRAGDSFTFATDAGDLDVLGTPAGTGGYPDLVRASQLMDLDGLRVHVVHIDDLIRMKRAAGRPKDLIEAEVLGALREEIDRAR